MTEKQGGSDVRANTTPRATPVDGDAYAADRPQVVLLGADVRRVPRARAGAGGLSCFLLPRLLPDGTRNAFRIQRLKDKLGNRSNASSEIEFDGASALRWSATRGAACATIIEMVNHTRLDCVLGTAALHARRRSRRRSTTPGTGARSARCSSTSR